MMELNKAFNSVLSLFSVSDNQARANKIAQLQLPIKEPLLLVEWVEMLKKTEKLPCVKRNRNYGIFLLESKRVYILIRKEGGGYIGKGANSSGVMALTYEEPVRLAHIRTALETNATYKNAVSEVNCLKAVKGIKGVVQIIDHYYYKSQGNRLKRGLFLDYCEGPDLYNLAINRELTDQKVIRFAKMLLQAMGFIHSKGVIHRDIKLDNIRLKNGEPVIVDFGFACFDWNEPAKEVIKGSISHLSPEILQAFRENPITAIVTQKSDIWALMICFYQMFHLKTLPFLDKQFDHRKPEEIEKVFEGIDKFHKHEPIKNSFDHLIWEGLNPDHKTRPHAKMLEKWF